MEAAYKALQDARRRTPLSAGIRQETEGIRRERCYYIDPQSGAPHIYGHDVTEPEVEAVLQNPLEDYPGREGSRIAIGQTSAGRVLRVICVPDPESNSVFVITAYDLRGKPLIAYRRRRRRK